MYSSLPSSWLCWACDQFQIASGKQVTYPALTDPPPSEGPWWLWYRPVIVIWNGDGNFPCVVNKVAQSRLPKTSLTGVVISDDLVFVSVRASLHPAVFYVTQPHAVETAAA